MDQKTSKIVNIFKKISWLDKNRWKLISGEDDFCSINLSSRYLTNSDKLLTHFLCYISDRGMTYSQIWDKGGFVYSNIVSEYENSKNIENLLNPNLDGSFYKQINDDGKTPEKYGFVSKITIPDDKNNVLIKDYRYKINKTVTFIPRFYPSDLKSIMQTLMILADDKFNHSIVRFIAFVMKELGGDTSVKKLAFALYLLGYYEIGQPKRDEYSKIKEGAQKNTAAVLDILNDKIKFEKMFQKKWISINFNQKRVWCSLRDYVKSPEFKGYMIDGFKDIQETELIEKWNKLNASELELPGDVWNNKSKFKTCLFDDLVDIKKNRDAPRFIRKVYDEYKGHISIDEGYPEMFDVTFDFVPRMCSRDLCDLCIFKEDNKLKKLCTKDETKYCPVVLISCGYANMCKIEGCPVVDDSRKT